MSHEHQPNILAMDVTKPQKNVHQGVLICVIAAIVFFIYSNTSKAPFILDDVFNIQLNPHIRLTELTLSGIKDAALKSPSSNRPIANISFALNYYFHKYDVFGYHLVNLIIHIVNSILLYFFIKYTLILSQINAYGDKKSRVKNHPETLNQQLISCDFRLTAFYAALIWAVNPLHIQSVTYIVQRMNSMATMFFMFSLLLYIKGRWAYPIRIKAHVCEKKCNSIGSKDIPTDPFKTQRFEFNNEIDNTSDSRPAYSLLYFSGAMLSGIAAFASKEITITLPIVVFLYEWFFFQHLSFRWLKRHAKYLLGLLTILILVGIIFLSTDHNSQKLLSLFDKHGFTLTQRVLTEFRVIMYYISLIFFPHPYRLELLYDFPLSSSLINPFTTILSIGTVSGLFIIAICIVKKERLIAFGILWFLGNLVIESSVIPLALIFEHRTYLPSMLISIVFVILIGRFVTKRWIINAALCVVVAVCSFWTYERNKIWEDEIALWNDCLKESPENLGKLIQAIGKVVKPLAVNPDRKTIHYNLGHALEKRNRFNDATDNYLAALRLDSSYDKALNNLGVIYIKEGRIKDAITMLSKTVAINPDYYGAHYNLGRIYLDSGKIKKAIFHFEEALRVRPNSSQINYYLKQAISKQSIK